MPRNRQEFWIGVRHVARQPSATSARRLVRLVMLACGIELLEDADLGHQDRVGVGHGRDPRSKLDRACGYPSSTSSPASAGASAGRAVRSSIGPAEAACLAVRGFEDRHAGIGPAANASPPISEGSVNLHRAAEMGPPQDP